MLYKHKVLSSFVLAVLLGLLCYGWELVPFSWLESFDKLYFTQKIIGRKQSIDDALFINMGYDKALADTNLYNSGGLFVGTIAITDRNKLDHLLRRMEEEDTYRYIFLDVRFESGIKTPYDSALFHRIAEMRDIVIATHRDMKLASPVLESKAYLSDYKTTISSTGFTRYQFIQKGKMTAPLKIYKDLTGHEIRRARFLPLYYYDGPWWKACLNSLFLRIPVDFSGNMEDVFLDQGSTTGIHRLLYYDYGPQIDDDFDLRELSEGKIVIIGDFVEDMVGTYLGEQPNPYLAYLATKSLLEGKHIVSPFIIILILIYWGLIILALSWTWKSGLLWVVDHIPKLFRLIMRRPISQDNKEKKKWVLFIRYFFCYSFDFFLISILLFSVCQVVFSFLIPSLFFTILGGITDTWNNPDNQTASR